MLLSKTNQTAPGLLACWCWQVLHVLAPQTLATC
jgi:hypothetical protein